MRHASKFIALTIALCGANASFAQKPADVCATARSAKAAGSTPGDVTPAEVCRVLSVLAHDSLEGRGTGTVGGARAARFIAAEMKAAGLEPGGDSGFFQRVPLAVAARGNRSSLVSSFAARDTLPPDRRGLAVNVIGILRGSDPVLKDSVVLVDAHYDHLGLRTGGPVDVDSIQAFMALAAPILAERVRYAQANGLSSRS